MRQRGSPATTTAAAPELARCVAAEGACVVQLFSDNNHKGTKATFCSESTYGKEIKLPAAVQNSVSSMKTGKSCKSVELFDEDDCEDGHPDNMVVRGEDGRGSLPYDLDNDVCKLKVRAGVPKICKAGTSSCEVTLYQDANLKGQVLGTYSAASCDKKKGRLLAVVWGDSKVHLEKNIICQDSWELCECRICG